MLQAASKKMVAGKESSKEKREEAEWRKEKEKTRHWMKMREDGDVGVGPST